MRVRTYSNFLIIFLFFVRMPKPKTERNPFLLNGWTKRYLREKQAAKSKLKGLVVDAITFGSIEAYFEHLQKKQTKKIEKFE
jgi:hypothetical protein